MYRLLPSTTQRDHLVPLLLVLAVVANLFVFALAGYSSYESRLNVQRAVEIETRNLARTLDYSLSEKFKRIDLALNTAAREYARLAPGGRLPSTEFDDYLLQTQKQIPELDGLRITDTRGDIVHNPGTPGVRNVSVADRDYFQALRQQPSGDNYVGQAILSRVTNQWVIPVARRLEDRQGHFSGVVYATIRVNEIERLLASIQLDPQDAILLRDQHLRMIARYPALSTPSGEIGNQLVSPELKALLDRKDLVEGSYFTHNTGDQTPRQISFRKLPDLPLLVFFGKSKEAYLAAWYRQTFRYFGFALLFLLASILALRQIRLGWARQNSTAIELERTKNTLETVTELSSDWVYWRSEDYQQFFYNSALCEKLSGYSLEDFQHNPRLLDTIIHPDDRERWDNHAHASEQHVGEEYRIITKQGETRWISHSCRRVYGPDGAPIGRRGSNVDITAKKQAEIELQHSEQRLTAIFRSSPVGIAISTLNEGVVIDANDAFVALYGFQPGTLIGSDTINNRLWESPAERERFIQQLWAEKHLRNWETRMNHRDGRLLDMLVSGEILELAGTRYLLSVHMDITERKQFEQEMLRAMEAAQAANIAKGRFLAVMSHELRTPLNGMMGMAQMLMLPDIAAAERIEFAQTINKSGQTLLALLTGILDHAKIEAGKLTLDSHPFRPTEVLQGVGELFCPVARNKGLDFQLILPPEGLYIKGDPSRLRQVLSNLVSNAIKFTEHGAVTLAATPSETAQGSTILRFAITDTGVGIPEDRRSALFQAFTQLDNGTTRRHEGTGLGLAISQNLVRLMGSSIQVDTAPGGGSVFSFELACSDPVTQT